MSSISEVQFAFYGMIAAIVSTLMVVCQTMYTKRCLETIQELDPLLLHLYTSTTAMLFVLPYLIYSAGSYYLAYGGMATENLQALDVVRSLIDPFSVISFLQPMLIVLLGVGCVYIQNMSSLAFLHATSTTSHQVATTCNKFTVIVSTIFIFHEPASTTNVLGFVIAGVGFLCYTTATEEKKIKDFSLGVEEIFVDQDNILPLQTKQSKVDIEMGTIVKTKISPKSVEPIVEMEKDEWVFNLFSASLENVTVQCYAAPPHLTNFVAVGELAASVQFASSVQTARVIYKFYVQIKQHVWYTL